MSHYYHAGVVRDGTVHWSAHTRRSHDAAVKEARRMARSGGRPCVEWWARAAGLRPGYDAQQGFILVESEVAS